MKPREFCNSVKIGIINGQQGLGLLAWPGGPHWPVMGHLAIAKRSAQGSRRHFCFLCHQDSSWLCRIALKEADSLYWSRSDLDEATQRMGFDFPFPFPFAKKPCHLLCKISLSLNCLFWCHPGGIVDSSLAEQEIVVTVKGRRSVDKPSMLEIEAPLFFYHFSIL